MFTEKRFERFIIYLEKSRNNINALSFDNYLQLLKVRNRFGYWAGAYGPGASETVENAIEDSHQKAFKKGKRPKLSFTPVPEDAENYLQFTYKLVIDKAGKVHYLEEDEVRAKKGEDVGQKAQKEIGPQADLANWYMNKLPGILRKNMAKYITESE